MEKIKILLQKPKAKIVVMAIACLVLIVGTVTAIGLNNSKETEDTKKAPPTEDDNAVDAFAENSESSVITEVTSENPFTEQTTAPSTSPRDTLMFESNKDGTCSVIGIGSYQGSMLTIPSTDSEGNTVTSVSDGAFDGCKTLEVVNIPSSVKKIGTGAFLGCTSLKSFTVNSANTKYCSVGGVLFSKDKTTLVCYPQNKIGKSYYLSTNVRNIAAYAFDGAVYLNSILYEGSIADFQSIKIDLGNERLNKMSVTCNYVPAK